MGDMILLHLGCADRYYPGFINSDFCEMWKGKKRKLDQVMDITKPWPYPDESVEGIVSVHVFQQLTWRGLIFALRESYRVLVKGGVMRIGVPMIENGKPLDYLLGWRNTNLFCKELLNHVLKEIGFSKVYWCKYKESQVREFIQVDNRPEQTLYVEVTK